MAKSWCLLHRRGRERSSAPRGRKCPAALALTWHSAHLWQPYGPPTAPAWPRWRHGALCQSAAIPAGARRPMHMCSIPLSRADLAAL
eukprot:15453611-Alexandrium_andersonii.AAC.1